MPTTTADLRRIVKSKYPFVENNFDLILDIVWNATENSDAFEEIAEQLKKERLDQLDMKSMLATGEVVKMAPSDTDNVRSNFDPADQYSVGPASTANISVTSNSRGSFMSEAPLISSIWLKDKTQTISSSENKTSWTISGLSRPINKEMLSNNKQAEGEVEKVESPAFYYPQLPEHSSVVGWSHHEPEGIQTSEFLSGSYHGFQSINQSTGTGQPAARNNKGHFQDPRKHQSFPPLGN